MVAPGASERTEGRLLKLVESALGVPARIVDRAPLTGSAEPALLLDRDTTAAEVKALWELRSPRHVVAASGGWLTGERDSRGWTDAARWPHETRMSVDFALPGPLVGPLFALPQWSDSLGSTSCRPWLHLATEWRREGVVCLGARLRQSSARLDTGRELHELAELPRPRSDWWLANRFILPDAERRVADLSLPSDSRQLAIVGAQRSGTTWASELLGSVEGTETMHERRAFDLLIEGFPRATEPQGVPVWQTTFLTCCRHLLASLSTKASIVAVVRDPLAVVRSMLFNWSDLNNVASLVANVSGRPLPERELERAVLVISSAWSNLAELVRASPDGVTLVDYETLCGDPLGIVGQIARRLGWKGRVNVRLEPAPSREFPDLNPADRRTIERELREPFLALASQAVKPR